MKRMNIGIPVAALLLLAGIHWIAYGQFGGGFGGGGGGMGGGATSNTPHRDKILGDLAANPVQWSRPAGDPPKWLQNGKAAHEADELLREQLNRIVEDEAMKFEEVPLNDVIKYLGDKHKIDFEINKKDLSDESVPWDVPVTQSSTKGTLREILRRVLEAHQLTYIVHEHFVEITSLSKANERPVIRYYDLSYVQSDSRHVRSLIEAIEMTITPENWQSNGGQGSIFVVGPLLVVSTTECAHLDIERFLYRLSTSNPNVPLVPTLSEYTRQ